MSNVQLELEWLSVRMADTHLADTFAPLLQPFNFFGIISANVV